MTEIDLGVPIDLILPETYSNQDHRGIVVTLLESLLNNPIFVVHWLAVFFMTNQWNVFLTGPLDQADEALLEEELAQQIDSKRL